MISVKQRVKIESLLSKWKILTGDITSRCWIIESHDAHLLNAYNSFVNSFKLIGIDWGSLSLVDFSDDIIIPYMTFGTGNILIWSMLYDVLPKDLKVRCITGDITEVKNMDLDERYCMLSYCFILN